ncbi:uncharacterized protein BDV14DRAFT_164784 [Aspergillus stella-maris]|uniref:uncharacterized protein n=1 Tax=Aspergillus stella-maris TaxID=1810926 RepID=UPI003CCCD017
MRLNVTTLLVAFLGTSSTATALSAGQTRGNNKACEANCEEGASNVLSSKESVFSARSYDSASVFTSAECFVEPPTQTEPEDLEAICGTVDGVLCGGSCVFPQSQSMTNTFSNGCEELGGRARFVDGVSGDGVVEACKS